MSSDSAPINLTNHFLIAMPGLRDELFGKSVVYLCEHTPQGALGLIINKPAGLSLGELFAKLDLPLQRKAYAELPVLNGGPLQTERGFILHEAMGQAHAVGEDETPAAIAQAIRDAWSSHVSIPALNPQGQDNADAEGSGRAILKSAYASTLRVSEELEMTTSRDVLEALSSGAGPKRILATLGYASWGEGQLESELAENSWLTVAADPSVMFETPVDQRYQKAMGLLGLEPWMLAPGAGHA